MELSGVLDEPFLQRFSLENWEWREYSFQLIIQLRPRLSPILMLLASLVSMMPLIFLLEIRQCRLESRELSQPRLIKKYIHQIFLILLDKNMRKGPFWLQLRDDIIFWCNDLLGVVKLCLQKLWQESFLIWNWKSKLSFQKFIQSHDYYHEIFPLLSVDHLGSSIIPQVKRLSLVDEGMLVQVRYHLHINEFFFLMSF